MKSFTLSCLFLLFVSATPVRAEEGSTKGDERGGETPAPQSGADSGTTKEAPAPTPAAPAAGKPAVAPPATSAAQATPATPATAPPQPNFATGAAQGPAAAALGPTAKAPLAEVEDEDEAELRREDDPDGVAKAPRKRPSHRCTKFCERRCKGTHHRLTLMVGGMVFPVTDPTWAITDSRSSVSQPWAAVEYWLHPRIGISVSGGQLRSDGYLMAGEEQAATDWEGQGQRFDVEFALGQVDVAARVVITPPEMPLRFFARAGGGFWYGSVVVSTEASQVRLDETKGMGAAPYALVGGGMELTLPRRRGDHLLPLVPGLLFEGGARLGGGGVEKGAPSINFDNLGRLDLGAPYFRMGVSVAL